MSEIDANILSEGKRVIATKEQEGTLIEVSDTDATCLIQDANGKKHLAVKIVKVEGDNLSNTDISAQGLTENNELVVAIAEQDGNIIVDNGENDYNCLVETENGKQLAVKTFALEGTPLKTGGDKDATCLIEDENGNKQLALKVFNLGGSADWQDKPADWSDIRKDCPANSIALYAGVKSDYSSYDNLGFTATCIGGYKVYIDGNVYGSYASGSTCNITWSTSGITTGDDITTPSALKAHKIWIEPATSGNNITAFHCARVAESGQEVQGLLWEHFNLTNSINIQELNATGSLASSNYSNPALVACTAKNNTLNFSEIKTAFLKCEKLTYVPTFNFTGGSSSINASFAFTNCSLLESVVLNDLLFYSASYTFHNCYKLKEVLGIKYTSARNMDYFITKSTDLKDTVVDVSSANYLKTVGCFGTSSYFMGGLKGLRVSSSAPFDATAPQINVSYTGMDRNAIVQLFNDLPANVGYTAVGSPTITSGIMSNISTSNYAKTDTSFTMTDEDSWVLEVPIITGNDIDSGQNVISEDTHFSIGIGEVNKHFNYYLSNNGTSWTTTDGAGSVILSANTNYTWKGEYNGQTKIFNAYVKTGNGDYELDYTNTGGIKCFTRFLKFGVSRTTVSPWKGSIDIANSKFYINGNSCYAGKVSSAKTITVVSAYGDSVILSNVGAPTIIDGVITKMDANNFVKTGSFAIGDSANWSAEIPLITGNDISSAQNFFSEKDHYSFSCGVNGGKFAYSLSKNGISWAVSDYGTHTLQPNTLYYWKVEYNATSKVFNGYIKEEGGTYELDFTYTEGIQNPTQYLQFGVSRSSSLPWLGSIVLKDVVITVNDTVWLTDGNFLYPADKVIATNKGWTLLV